MNIIEEIKKGGYVVEIHSWENDLDNPRSSIMAGLKCVEALVIQEFAKTFATNHGMPDKSHMGNSEITDDSLTTVAENFDNLVEKYEYSLPEDENFKEKYFDHVLTDMIGDWADGEYWRVVSKVKVYYINKLDISGPL